MGFYYFWRTDFFVNYLNLDVVRMFQGYGGGGDRRSSGYTTSWGRTTGECKINNFIFFPMIPLRTLFLFFLQTPRARTLTRTLRTTTTWAAAADGAGTGRTRTRRSGTTPRPSTRRRRCWTAEGGRGRATRAG